MGDTVVAAAGFVIILFTFGMMVYALPSMLTVLTTGNGTIWENSTTFIVSAVNTSKTGTALLPIMAFIAGLALLYKGMKG